MARLSANTSQSFSRFMLSYARSKSTKHKPIYLFVLILCCIKVCKIRAYSIVPWWALNPACVGACNYLVIATSVKRLFMIAMNSFERGGATAMLL
jgi:hypothetical protein